MPEVVPFTDLVGNPEFIKVGEFSKNHLIWWTRRIGYFVTDRMGFDFNGSRRIRHSDLSVLIKSSRI
jgi:hypothetical protein